MATKYSPRYSAPSQSNKWYYSSSPYKGIGCSIFNWHSGKQGNCTAYAWGRFMEIAEHYGKSVSLSASGNAEDWYYGTNSGKKRGKNPQLGAIICYANGPYSGLGHVMVVEQIVSKTHIICSESGYGAYLFKYPTHVYKKKGVWVHGSYDFQGFIYHPCVPWDASVGDAVYDTSTSSSGAVSEYTAQVIKATAVKANITYKTVKTQVTTTKLKTYTGDLDRTKSTSLLSYPSLVESPFVIVKLDNFTFGSYMKRSLTTEEKAKYRVIYPNYIKSLNVVKVNGTVNQYTLTLVHQIEAGTDPNFIDKVLSRVGYGNIYITYGDFASPTFVYKEEQALITKVTSNVDFANSRITYTIYCTSSSLSLASNTYNWLAREAKPSDRIIEILTKEKYGLLDVFYGMKNISKQVLKSTLIANDDKVVKIPAKKNMDPLSYINFLVTCMTCETNTKDVQAIKDSSYYMTIHDDVYGDQSLNGPYFKITKVKSNSKTIQTADTYEVDINYPSENMVTSFTINNDNSWALLYSYSNSLGRQRYYYSIGDDGIVNTDDTPNTLVSADKFKMVTEAQKTWWTKMTQFPVTATMTIKGLVRPAMLMTYIRVNAFFYGQRHIASGLYIITKQEDKIDGNGYRTTLTMQRVAGDTDYFYTSTKTVTSKIVDNITYSGGTSTTTTKTTALTAREKNEKFYNKLEEVIGKNNITDTFYEKYTKKQWAKMSINGQTAKAWYTVEGESTSSPNSWNRYTLAFNNFGAPGGNSNVNINVPWYDETMIKWRKTKYPNKIFCYYGPNDTKPTTSNSYLTRGHKR